MATDNPMTGVDILDMLFDPNDGVLKSEVPKIQTIDFDELGLINDSGLFTDLINDQQYQQPDKKAKTIKYTDHDYFAQKSPAQNSDSGISTDSNTGSPSAPSEDLSDMNFAEDYLSESPQSITDIMQSDSGSLLSPSDSHSEFNMLQMENFDFKDLDMDLDTIDSTSLLEKDSTTCKDSDQISIDFDFASIESTDDYKAEEKLISMSQSECKTIKILHLPSTSSSSTTSPTLPFTVNDLGDSKSLRYPDLVLSDEEKTLLAREGVSLPENMPLTKEEERALKAVRRKIRNKISAKESRKRKVSYVEGLEKRVKLCTTENQQLHKKVSSLEKQNMSIMAQLKKLQALVGGKTSKQSNTTTTCLAVLLLSFAFLVVPSFNPFGRKDDLSPGRPMPMPGKSRSLLHQPEASNIQDEDPYGISSRPTVPWQPSLQSAVTTKTKSDASLPSKDSVLKSEEFVQPEMLTEIQKSADLNSQKNDVDLGSKVKESVGDKTGNATPSRHDL